MLAILFAVNPGSHTPKPDPGVAIFMLLVLGVFGLLFFRAIRPRSGYSFLAIFGPIALLLMIALTAIAILLTSSAN